MPTHALGKKVFPNTIIRASAGTGKTYQLSNRYLRLLAAGVAPETILASTFTRKAAGEILDRIIQRLARSANSEAAASELAEQLGHAELDRAKAERLVVMLLARLDRLQISTLDSFFAQLARRYCLELGLSPHWTIVDEARDVWLREEATRRILSHGQAAELIHLLAKGETDRSVGMVIDDTLQSLYDIYLDAVDSAWDSLPHRAAMEPAALRETLEALKAVPLEKASLLSAREGDLDAFESADFDAFIKKGLGKCVLADAESYKRATIPADLRLYYQRLLDHLSAVKLQEQAARLISSKRLLDAFDHEYQALKHQEHALRFDDVTRQLDQGLTRQPPVYDPLQGEQRVDHVLLDEFQDTSPIQWRILKPVAEKVVQQAGGSLLCVGDIKQAIYGWRGGVAEILEQVEAWLGDNAETIPLVNSYRSAPVIMEAVNEIFQNLNRHPELGNEPGVRGWQQRFETHASAKRDLAGHVQLCSSADPFAYVAAQIAQRQPRHPDLSVAVLVRSNSDVGRMMNELARQGVEASEESGKSITDSPAVQIVLAALRWIDYPGDSLSRFHVALSPLGRAWGLDATERPVSVTAGANVAAEQRGRLLHDGYGLTIESWVSHLVGAVSLRERRRLGQLVDLAYLYDRQATLRPFDFVRHVSYRKVSDPSSAAVRVMNIHQSKGLEFDIVYLPDLEKRLIGQTPPFVTERPSPTERVSAVSPYLNQDLQRLMPPALSRRVETWQAQQISESLCLLYVALTRAARALYLVVEPPAGPSSKITKTWSGLILAGLNSGRPLEEEQAGYEIGDPNWFEQRVEPAEPAPPPTKLEARPLRFSIPARSSSRLIRSTSPSAQEGGRRVRAASLLQSGSAAAMTKGSAVHAVFEQIDWLEKIPELTTLQNHMAAFPMGSSERQDLSQELRGLLATEQAQAVLEPTRYRQWLRQTWPESAALDCQLSVHCEYGFATILDSQLWTGSIDRLVWIRAASKLWAADILDFKTDRIPRGDSQALAERVDYYRPQVEAYRRAIANMTRLPESQIAARLWFVHPNTLVNIDPAG